MRKIVVKEGPLVLVGRIIASEIILAILFYCISFLSNYESLFRATSFGQFIRYDVMLMLSFSLFQIILIMTLFLYWYFSYFEISHSEVTFVHGIIRRSRKSYLLSRLHSVVLIQGMLQRKMKHATLKLCFDGSRELYLRNVGMYEQANAFLRSTIGNKEKKGFSIGDILSLRESEDLELKETLRFDTRNNNPNKELEKAALKTIAGFLNAKGGTLIIGVADDGSLKGLERDFKTLKRQDRDGFENYLMVLVRESLGSSALHNVSVRFESKDEKLVCVIEASPSHEAVYLKNNEGREDLYVRAGNTTQPLSISEAERYIKEHFS